jgi:uncharacterized protein with GYD domain
MAVFWNDLNAYLVGAFTTAMGTGSAYTTLKAQTINDRVFADAHEWVTWTLPAISVACYQVDYAADEHMGAGSKVYRKRYRCLAFGIISGAVVLSPFSDTISVNLREYYERMEAVLRLNPAAVTSAGVYANGVTITRGELDIIRRPNDDIDSATRLGVAYFQFDVTARN